MRPLKINEIIKAIKGKLVTSSSSRLIIKNISTDTRTLSSGDLFFALKGPNFDGHNFLKDALRRGASGLVIAQKPDILPRHKPVIQVTNTVRALGDLARYYRSKISATIIAVTGSNGKTTTKEMIHHMLAQIVSKRDTFRSPKSFNNAIGVPLTLLAIKPHHRYVVFELGTNQPGEIAYLARIVKPDIGVITNIAPTHLESLKSLSGVARNKLALFKTLTAQNLAVYQSSNKWLKQVVKSAEYKCITFGKNNRANIQGQRLRVKPQGIEFLVNHRICCFIPVWGSWNMSNALASLAVMHALDFSLDRSARILRNFKLPPMRMEKKTTSGVTFINDAYNANPESMSQVLADLKQMSPGATSKKLYGPASGEKSAGRKIFVLGDMLELGKMSSRYHKALATQIAQAGVQILLTVGEAVRHTVKVLKEKYPKILVFAFTSTTEAGDTLKFILRKGDLVVLKGSRAIGLEKVI